MKKCLVYSLAVCLFSWTVFGVTFLALGGSFQSNSVLLTLIKAVYMLFPMLVAGVIQLINKEPFRSTGLLEFKINWTWLVALVLPVIAVAVCVLVSALFPGVSLHFGADQIISMQGIDEAMAASVQEQLSSMPPAALICATVISGLISGCTINAVFAFGEEYGWRNYMVSVMEGIGFWKKALVIGFVWGIWHFPLILLGHNYPQHPVLGVALMCVFCILTGIIELYLVLKSGSVYPAAIFHGTINALAGLVLLLVEGGNDITIGMSGLAGFIALLLTIAAIWIYDRYISADRIMG